MMILYKLAGVFFISIMMAANALSDQNEVLQSCLNAEPDDQLQLCKQAAFSLKSNQESLKKLGDALESDMHYESAVAVYQIASQQTTHNKTLLQSLIRARAAWRKQKSIEQIYATRENTFDQTALNRNAVTKGANEDCYRFKYQKALSACRKALAEQGNDARLQERVGDVLQSMERRNSALLAYKLALKLNPDNSELKRKQKALANLIDNNPSTKTKKQNIVSNVRQNNQLVAKVDSVAKKQIELLDRLYNQKVLSSDAYEFEKQAVLAQAGLQQNNQQSLDTSKTKSVKKRLQSLAVGNYHALIIGNNKYKSRDYPDLLTAVNDAKKIDSILKNHYGFKTRLLLNADRYSIVRAMSELRKSLKAEDKLLIYYAGHGILDDATNRGYWLPVDAETDSVANWVSANDVTDALVGLNAQHALVIADSCFSASLLRVANKSRIDEQDALLIRLNSKRSRTVLTSGGLEPVQDDGGGKHSVFANALITILENNNDILEAGKLFIQLRDKVILNADQTPQYAPIRKAGHDGGDFIFIPT